MAMENSSFTKVQADVSKLPLKFDQIEKKLVEHVYNYSYLNGYKIYVLR